MSYKASKLFTEDSGEVKGLKKFRENMPWIGWVRAGENIALKCLLRDVILCINEAGVQLCWFFRLFTGAIICWFAKVVVWSLVAVLRVVFGVCDGYGRD